jgi:chromate transporter
MVLPGPEAQQLAIYIGWKLHGKRGGVVDGTLFVLPSMFVLLALSLIYVKFGNLPSIAAMFNGLKPAVIALVVIAFHRLAKSSLRGPVQGCVAAAGFACMFFFDVSLLLVMLGATVLGIVFGRLWPGVLHRPSEAGAQEDEVGYYIKLLGALPKRSVSANIIRGCPIQNRLLVRVSALTRRASRRAFAS